MQEIKTRYGNIYVGDTAEYYEDGTLKEAILTGCSKLCTPYGWLIPNWRMSEGRKKYRNSVTFYPDGSLESIYLEEQTPVETPIGVVEAELLTFYPNGALERVFPLYGQLSGYWSEEEEFKLAREILIPLFGKQVACKPTVLHFYDTGELQSVTIWRQTKLSVPTIYGIVETKLGVELTRDGRLLSTEPVYGTVLKTKWGSLKAFDPAAFPMHAEDCSLKFREDGTLKEVCTVEVKNGKVLCSRRKLE